MFKVVGIDPGLSATGIGIVSGRGVAVDGYSFGCIHTSKSTRLSHRLDHIFSRLMQLFTAEAPDLVVVEDVFSLKEYPKSGITLGQVSGVVLLAAARTGLSAVQVPVREAKQALTGNDNASAQWRRAPPSRPPVSDPAVSFRRRPRVGHHRALPLRRAAGTAGGPTRRVRAALHAVPAALETTPSGRLRQHVIGYITGKILNRQDDRVLVLANQVGYEVLLPTVVMEAVAEKNIGDDIALYIYHQQTERQPKPVLIGFTCEIEKEFFQHFISVEDIGPMKAVKAMMAPISDIARAIESRDFVTLSRLKGIGKRTAQKIVATLEGRMGKFALKRDDPKAGGIPAQDFAEQVLDVMVRQLGHRVPDAKRMITEAFKRNASIATPEELFEEVYRGQQEAPSPTETD
jgi:Holliday junction DNA helicase RuvA